MAWDVRVAGSVVDDLRWLGRKTGRIVLTMAIEQLAADPLIETRNLKTLRPNPVAQRELRIAGKYRVLFNVDEESQEVLIVVIGEKRGESLWVQGQEYTAHESNPTE